MRSGPFSLHELSLKIQEVLNKGFEDSYWIFAEISEIKENRTGHCYLELVEKDTIGDQPKAKVRATIWAGIYRTLKPFFETSTGIRLTSGIKVLVLCSLNYHPVYGLSLNIQDIDPSFTLGDIEQKKRQTIEMLIAEGVFDMNKELRLPMLPKRIAIVSSPTAAGYQDFTNQLDSNPYDYSFKYKIFSAIVQGEKAEESMVDALGRINMELDSWDLVAIIRGGGSQTDLLCFDSYILANHIAQFPIPIITGIGHEKDTTVADLVANTRLKTPTAAAEFVISLMIKAESELVSVRDHYCDLVQDIISDRILELSKIQNKLIPNILKTVGKREIDLKGFSFKTHELINHRIHIAKQELGFKYRMFLSKSIQKLNSEQRDLSSFKDLLSKVLQFRITLAEEKLSMIEKNNESLNPQTVLKRGYSITLVNGIPIKNIENIKEESELETIVCDGKIKSTVKKVINKQNYV